MAGEQERMAASAWGGGESPFAVPWPKLMMWLFLLSDALTFAALLSGYGAMRLTAGLWPRQADFFNITYVVGPMTFILICSSATMAVAVGAARRGDRGLVVRFLGLTILGGLMFLGMQAFEWTSFIREGARLTGWAGHAEGVPPMFSALHAGGRRLHELARAGIEVPRAPRRVRIDAIELLDWTPPLMRLRVACGKGTYIRSLAADLGAVFGCGARLEALERTRVGAFTLADAVPWSALRDGDAAALGARVLPPDLVVAHLPAVRLDPAAADRLRRGQRLIGREADALTATIPCGPCRLYAGETFLGIGEAEAAGLRALRLLHADHPRSRPVSC